MDANGYYVCLFRLIKFTVSGTPQLGKVSFVSNRWFLQRKIIIFSSNNKHKLVVNYAIDLVSIDSHFSLVSIRENSNK